MNKMTYEEAKNSINERSAEVTKMLNDLKNGRDIDFNRFANRIASGFANELELLGLCESYRVEKEVKEKIDKIDIPSFMKK